MDALGFPAEWRFHDVLTVEPWAFEMVPSPVLAMMLLFPVKEASENHRLEENEKIVREGQASVFCLLGNIFITRK